MFDRIDRHDLIDRLRHTLIFSFFLSSRPAVRSQIFFDGRPSGGDLFFNFCDRRRRGRGPVRRAPAAAAAAAKIEKQITSGQPPVKNKIGSGRPDGRKKKRKNQSVSQTIDQVMAINSIQKSSKSELSLRGNRPFNIFFFYRFFLPQTVTSIRLTQAIESLNPSDCFA